MKREHVAIIFLSIAGSKLFWYDLRTIITDGRVELLKSSFLVYSLLLLPFIIYYIYSNYRPIIDNKVFTSFLIINIYGMLLGCIYSQVGLFYFQDVFKFLFVPAGMALSYHLYKNKCDLNYVIKRTLIVFYGFAVARFLVHFSLKEGGMIFGTVNDLLPLSGSLLELFAFKDVGGFITGIVVLMSVMSGQKRTLFIIAVAGILFLLAFFVLKKKDYWRTACGFFVSVFVLALVTGSVPGYNTVKNSILASLNQDTQSLESHPPKRIKNSFNTLNTDVGFESKRFREVKIAYNLLVERGASGILFGLGSGASFVDPVLNPVSGQITVHSLHFTVMAMFFRYGVIGILFYLFLVFSIILAVIRSVTLKGVIDFKNKSIIGMYLSGSIIMSVVVYGLVDDIFLGFFLGVLLFANKSGTSCQLKTVQN